MGLNRHPRLLVCRQAFFSPVIAEISTSDIFEVSVSESEVAIHLLSGDHNADL